MKLPLLISRLNDISACLKQKKKQPISPKNSHTTWHTSPKKQKYTTKHPRKHHAVNPLLKSEKQEWYEKKQILISVLNSCMEQFHAK